eukprot:gb/GECH01008274.1/.p1 GENE.gb/GECH01008274.1/~~gb/GECH01008274.1/.p1  ORF type:complete len:479 (+),score=52.56 gb/GECH01008274.1/:1-1437(+)
MVTPRFILITVLVLAQTLVTVFFFASQINKAPIQSDITVYNTSEEVLNTSEESPQNNEEPPQRPQFNITAYNTFEEAFENFLRFQKNYMKFTRDVSFYFDGDAKRTYAYLDSIGANQAVLYKAHISGLGNQIQALSSTFLLAMIKGVPHVYRWYLPCPLSTIAQETAEMGNLKFDKWKAFQHVWLDRAVKNSLIPLKRYSKNQDWNHLLTADNNESVFYQQYRNYFGGFVCQLNPHCKKVLFPDPDQILGTVARNLFLPSRPVVDTYWRYSNLTSIGMLSQHLRQCLTQFNHEEYEPRIAPITDDTTDDRNLSRSPVIGVHLRFGDQSKIEASSQATSFLNKDQFPLVMKCVSKMIQEQMDLKNHFDDAHLLIATDHADVVPEVKKHMQKEFHNRVAIHTTPGVPKHSSKSYKSCSDKAKTSFIKVFYDLIMLCHADVFFGTQQSTFSKIISGYCSSPPKRLEDLHLFNLPSVCKDPE